VRYRLGVLREALGDAALDDSAARLELAVALQAAIASVGRLPGSGDAASTSPRAGA